MTTPRGAAEAARSASENRPFYSLKSYGPERLQTPIAPTGLPISHFAQRIGTETLPAFREVRERLPAGSRWQAFRGYSAAKS